MEAAVSWVEELAATPPGPDLFALVEGQDPRACSGSELVDLLVAHQRQGSYQQARLLLTVRELAHAPRAGGAGVREEAMDPYADAEVAFALTISDYAAGQLLSTAFGAIDRIPALHEALTAGRLDLAKVTMVCSELSEVEQDTARAIVAELLAEAHRCTLAQLRERVRRLILSVDPDAVKQRSRKAVEHRFVEHAEYANGTAALSGLYLAKDRAAAAWNHIDAIARATKTGGDPLGREIDQIRADVFADLLAGVDPTLAGAATPAHRKGVIALHINTTTLACLDDAPGEIEGFGPVVADIARQTVAQMAEHAQWRFVVEDDDGQTVAEGRLKYRPTLAQTRFVNARDRTCRAPGCRRRAGACDRDHVIDHAHGGPTTIENLCCLCRRHHRAKHVGRFRIRRTEYGIDWTTPRGATYTVLPERGHPPERSFHVLLCHTLRATQPTKLRR